MARASGKSCGSRPGCSEQVFDFMRSQWRIISAKAGSVTGLPTVVGMGGAGGGAWEGAQPLIARARVH